MRALGEGLGSCAVVGLAVDRSSVSAIDVSSAKVVAEVVGVSVLMWLAVDTSIGSGVEHTVTVTPSLVSGDPTWLVLRIE